MPTVTIHAPKTPVTKGSNTVAAATLPNICKMPPPPPPFLPTPLPNIGRSAIRPSGFSTSVKIEGNTVAIRGSSFGSMGDIASKGTGGGILSMNCEGPTKFIAPGSLTVKIEGKNVHLLGDIMANNHNPAGAAPNSATMMGAVHPPGSVPPPVSAECQEAADTIQEVMHGSPKYKSIKKREAELKANPQQQPLFWADANPGVPRPPGSDQWGHLEQIEGQQNRMNKALQKYYANGCTNMDGPTLKEAGAYAVADPIDML